MIWIILVVSFLMSAWMTWRLTSPASRFYVIDHPNERSLHVRPTPRSGGIAILTAITAASGFQLWWRGEIPGMIPWIGFALLVVATVSFLDDRYRVSAAYRFVAHVAGAAMLLAGDLSLRATGFPGIGWIVPGWAAAVASVLFIVWMINLYNFMDGMDGFAGGMAVIGFATFSLFGWLAGDLQFTSICAVVAAASAGFLCFNFPPARIFMGDTGSSVLGLLAGSLSLWGVRDGIFPLWAAVLVFSPFIADATVTLLRRLWRREMIWRPHKTHYYQLLVQSGWGHRKTVLLEYGIMSGCAITALWCARAPGGTEAIAFGAWTLFYFGFFAWVSRNAARRHPPATDARSS